MEISEIVIAYRSNRLDIAVEDLPVLGVLLKRAEIAMQDPEGAPVSLYAGPFRLYFSSMVTIEAENARLRAENARLLEQLNVYQPAAGLAATLLRHVKELNESGYDLRDYGGAQAPGWSGLSDQIWSFVEETAPAAPPAQPQKEAQ